MHHSTFTWNYLLVPEYENTNSSPHSQNSENKMWWHWGGESCSRTWAGTVSLLGISMARCSSQRHCSSVSPCTWICLVLDTELLSSEEGAHGHQKKNSIQEMQNLCWALNHSQWTWRALSHPQGWVTTSRADKARGGHYCPLPRGEPDEMPDEQGQMHASKNSWTWPHTERSTVPWDKHSSWRSRGWANTYNKQEIQSLHLKDDQPPLQWAQGSVQSLWKPQNNHLLPQFPWHLALEPSPPSMPQQDNLKSRKEGREGAAGQGQGPSYADLAARWAATRPGRWQK